MRPLTNFSNVRRVGTAIALMATLASTTLAATTGHFSGPRVVRNRRQAAPAPRVAPQPGGGSPSSGSGIGSSSGEMRRAAVAPEGARFIAVDLAPTTPGVASDPKFDGRIGLSGTGAPLRVSSAVLRECRVRSSSQAPAGARLGGSYYSVGMDGASGLQAEAGYAFRLR